MPALTIAIPTCNGAPHLAEAVRSILDQQGLEFDLIVSDDRSEDETLEIVRQVAGDRARIEVNSERLGLAGNWNRCVELARTEWVTVFHQDDVMRPGHLARNLPVITAQCEPRPGLIAGAAEAIDEDGRPIPPSVIEPGGFPGDGEVAISVSPPGGRWLLSLLAVRNTFRCSAVTVRREVHAAVGGFDATYQYVVDWDFWIKVARGWPIACLLGPPTVAFRWHAASETHRFRSGTADLEEQERLLAKLYASDSASLPMAHLLRSAADRRLARAYLNRAYDAARAGDRRLAARCLRRALGLRPASLGLLLRDPRFLARLVLGRA